MAYIAHISRTNKNCKKVNFEIVSHGPFSLLMCYRLGVCVSCLYVMFQEVSINTVFLWWNNSLLCIHFSEKTHSHDIPPNFSFNRSIFHSPRNSRWTPRANQVNLVPFIKEGYDSSSMDPTVYFSRHYQNS